MVPFVLCTALPACSAGDVGENLVGLHHAGIDQPVEDGAPLTAAGDDPGAAEHGEMLAHVRHLAADAPAEVADRAFTLGELLDDAEPLRVRERLGDRCSPRAQLVAVPPPEVGHRREDAAARREDLDGRFVETSRDGWALAMDVSAYSLVALVREARPLLHPGASVISLTYYGAEKVVAHYNLMGVAKAALEASTRYLAADLGPSGIRVNAISAGPIRTLAASGIAGFRKLYGTFAEVAPLRSNITIDDVGGTAVWLASDLSRQVTGEIVHVDAGFSHVVGGIQRAGGNGDEPPYFRCRFFSLIWRSARLRRLAT